VNGIGNAEERLVRLQEAVARSLELLECGRVGEAREELARSLPVGAGEREMAVTDREIDVAFASAEAEPECMMDTDTIARAAIHQAESELSEESGLASVDEDAAPGEPQVIARFATATMADVLEQQGDLDGADQIRAGLDPWAGDGPSPRPSRRDVVDTLEHWLENLRGGVRR